MYAQFHSSSKTRNALSNFSRRSKVILENTFKCPPLDTLKIKLKHWNIWTLLVTVLFLYYIWCRMLWQIHWLQLVVWTILLQSSSIYTGSRFATGPNSRFYYWSLKLYTAWGQHTWMITYYRMNVPNHSAHLQRPCSGCPRCLRLYGWKPEKVMPPELWKSILRDIHLSLSSTNERRLFCFAFYN